MHRLRFHRHVGGSYPAGGDNSHSRTKEEALQQRARVPLQGPLGLLRDRAGRLAYPRGIAVDAAGNVYVANTGNDRIDVFDKGGTLLRSFGASGRAAGQFDAPVGVTSDAGGTRAVTDWVNGRVQLLNPDGTVASSWGSPAPGPTILPDPVAVAFDASGNAYVLDRRRSRIIVFARATGLPVRTIGSPGSGPGQLLNPSALTIDGGGTIVVADSGNQRIARFGTGGSYLGATTGVGDGRGIAVSTDGSRTYLSTAGHRIEVYDPSGSEIDEFGGEGSKIGKLESPGQIALDAAGNLWVADRGNNRIQEFGPDGERLGAFGVRGIGLGQFVHPSGLSLDCNGVLTVTDSDNNRVQQFALTAPAATTCAAPIPVGNPPAPKLPTLPAPLGPQVTLRVLRTHRHRLDPHAAAAPGLRHDVHDHRRRDGHPRRGAAEEAPPCHGGARDGQAHARGRRHEDRAPDAVAGERAAAGEGPARAAGARRQRADLRDGDDRGAGGGHEAAAGDPLVARRALLVSRAARRAPSGQAAMAPPTAPSAPCPSRCAAARRAGAPPAGACAASAATRTWSASSSADGEAPSLGTIHATMRSPRSGSGSPVTAASRTPGCSSSAPSISPAPIL